MQLAREHPEMDHPLPAAYRAPNDAPSVAAKASAAQRLYDALPPVCPDCGNADAEALSPGMTGRAPPRRLGLQQRRKLSGTPRSRDRAGGMTWPAR